MSYFEDQEDGLLCAGCGSAVPENYKQIPGRPKGEVTLIQSGPVYCSDECKRGCEP